MEGRTKAGEESPGFLGMTLAFLSGQWFWLLATWPEPQFIYGSQRSGSFQQAQAGPRGLQSRFRLVGLAFHRLKASYLCEHSLLAPLSAGPVAGVTAPCPRARPSSGPFQSHESLASLAGVGAIVLQTEAFRWPHAARSPGLLQVSLTPASVLWSYCYLRTGL